MLVAFLLAQAAPCTPISGGPTEGMCSGGTVWRDGDVSGVAVLPALGQGRPIPAEQAALVRSALAAYDARSEIPASLRTADARSMYCASFLAPDCLTSEALVQWRHPAGMIHRSPYLLWDGRIRIEWMRDGKLALLSFIRFADGRITRIDTIPAEMPVKEKAPTP